MKRILRNRMAISFTRGMFLYIALLLMMIPFRLFAAVVISAVIHECFHIASIRIMGKEIHALQIGPRGAIIHTQIMSDKEELICALAGPLSGFFLIFFFKWTPVIALTGFVHSLYNLLPIYPTDGGRILRCGMRLLFPCNVADKVQYWTEVVTLSIISAVCAYGTVFLRLGIIPAILAAALLLKSSKRK